MDYNNLFYYNHNDNTRQKNDFDSYSKTPDDILNFYLKKFEHVDFEYKNDTILSIDEFNKFTNIFEENDFIKLFLNSSKPFELYIIGTVIFMENKLDLALLFYLKEIQLLENDNTLSALANRTMAHLYISSIYELKRNRKESLRHLFKVLKIVDKSSNLYLEINNLLASAYSKIGYSFINTGNKSLANHFFYKSIKIRFEFISNYDCLVFDNYVSQAFRYYSHTLSQPFIRYQFLKDSLIIRQKILLTAKDQLTKTELAYLIMDIIRFLLENNCKEKLINKYTKALYKNLAELNKNSIETALGHLLIITLNVSKFYLLKKNLKKFYQWFSLYNYLIVNHSVTNVKIDSRLLVVYNQIK